MLRRLGSQVEYGGQLWRVGGIAWLGERYYFLTQRGEVAMLPASLLEGHA